MSTKSSRGPKKKIVRVSEKYGLDGIGAEMAQLWTHPDKDERFTLKNLRDYFNRSVLEAAIDESDMDAMPGFVEKAYDTLIYESDPIKEEEIRIEFENHSVNIDKIMEQFISSKQTIHNYLVEVEDVKLHPEQRLDEKKEKSLNHLQSLDKRYENIVSDIIERLVKEKELPKSDYDVTVECFVENKNSGEEINIKDILRS